ncbi:arsenate reductase [Vibrio sp. SS-MA-C1-2]|uniref:arsenate reductase n=1 Tax=Vibrio sp. SS-MA-C1-2 TaxID=2908646 RepID=UPI001F462970|nr:arsenate reductase [Vibrio sp. SS-MA-C1-2]UJF19791.1 arsenate reductase [Vibrio sp. SS-MA-C1-2]
MSDITLYGLSASTCDTMKKACKWLENNGNSYSLHNYRVEGLTLEQLTIFEASIGWETLVNKRSTTYRQLSDAQKKGLNKESAITLMLEQPTLIKRPLLSYQGNYYVGFKADQYNSIFNG